MIFFNHERETNKNLNFPRELELHICELDPLTLSSESSIVSKALYQVRIGTSVLFTFRISNVKNWLLSKRANACKMFMWAWAIQTIVYLRKVNKPPILCLPLEYLLTIEIYELTTKE